jgi:hypothetical protein
MNPIDDLDELFGDYICSPCRNAPSDCRYCYRNKLYRRIRKELIALVRSRKEAKND